MAPPTSSSTDPTSPLRAGRRPRSPSSTRRSGTSRASTTSTTSSWSSTRRSRIASTPPSARSTRRRSPRVRSSPRPRVRWAVAMRSCSRSRTGRARRCCPTTPSRSSTRSTSASRTAASGVASGAGRRLGVRPACRCGPVSASRHGTKKEPIGGQPTSRHVKKRREEGTAKKGMRKADRRGTAKKAPNREGRGERRLGQVTRTEAWPLSRQAGSRSTHPTFSASSPPIPAGIHGGGHRHGVLARLRRVDGAAAHVSLKSMGDPTRSAERCDG